MKRHLYAQGRQPSRDQSGQSPRSAFGCRSRPEAFVHSQSYDFAVERITAHMASTDIRELLRLVPECFGGVVKIEISRGNETFISAFVQEDKVIFSGASHADESFVKTDVHLVLKDALDSRTIGNMRIMSFVPLSLDIHSPGDRADTKKVLGMLSSLIARTIDAKLDGLTALPVRKYFQRTLEEHVARFLSDGRGFSLISADIDRFKDINDEFGHDAGDRVLSAIGRILHNSVRGRSDCTDSVFRNGGEEFGIILSDASIYEAISIGERFRLSIKSHDFGIGRTVTCSFGVAEISEVSGAGDLGKALYKLADERLYQAKDIGRDSVVASESGTSQVRMKAVTLDKAVNE